MGWNYRVMRHTEKNPATGETVSRLAIHEAHYRNDDVDDHVVPVHEVGYTENPVSVTGETIDELKATLQLMLAALEKPVLDMGEHDAL